MISSYYRENWTYTLDIETFKVSHLFHETRNPYFCERWPIDDIPHEAMERYQTWQYNMTFAYMAGG